MTSENERSSIGLCYFRNLVARCYREARYIGTAGKLPLFERYYPVCMTKLKYGRTWVIPVFQQVWRENDVSITERTYADRLDGLNLAELQQVFAHGIWKLNIGGKKWAIIAEHAIALREAIDQKDMMSIGILVERIDGLWHNTRRVVEDFIEPCQ